MGNKNTLPPQVQTLLALHADFVRLFEAAIKSEQDMHMASLAASQALLDSALKGAENVSPENFAVLVGALERVELARIQALEKVALASLENGRAAIKMFDHALQAAITGGLALGNRNLDIQQETLDVRKKELKVKQVNSRTEAKKEGNAAAKAANA